MGSFTRRPAQSRSSLAQLWYSRSTSRCSLSLCQEQDCSTRIVDFSKNANSNFTLSFFFQFSRNSDSSLLIEINSDFPYFFPQKSRSNFKIRVRLPNMTDWHILPESRNMSSSRVVVMSLSLHNIECFSRCSASGHLQKFAAEST